MFFCNSMNYGVHNISPAYHPNVEVEKTRKPYDFRNMKEEFEKENNISQLKISIKDEIMDKHKLQENNLRNQLVSMSKTNQNLININNKLREDLNQEKAYSRRCLRDKLIYIQEINKIKDENKEINGKNFNMKNEIQFLNDENDDLRNKLGVQMKENDRLVREIERLRKKGNLNEIDLSMIHHRTDGNGDFDEREFSELFGEKEEKTIGVQTEKYIKEDDDSTQPIKRQIHIMNNSSKNIQLVDKETDDTNKSPVSCIKKRFNRTPLNRISSSNSLFKRKLI